MFLSFPNDFKSTELEVVTVWEQWCVPTRIYLRVDTKLSKIAQETSSLACSSCLPEFFSCSLAHSNYSFSSPQGPPWGQKKVSVVEKWPVHGGLNKGQCMDCPPPKRVAAVKRWLLVGAKPSASKQNSAKQIESNSAFILLIIITITKFSNFIGCPDFSINRTV